MKNGNELGRNLGKKIGMVLIIGDNVGCCFKQAQDHRKWWGIEWPGVFTYQNRKSLGPLNDAGLCLNKPKIIENGGELSDLEYLLTKIEKVKYLQNVGTHTSHLCGTFNQHYIIFK